MESSTNTVVLQQLIQNNEKMEQIEKLLTSIKDSNSTLPESIQNVLNIQLKKMLDNQQSIHNQIMDERNQTNQLANQQFQNVRDIQVCLGNEADRIIKEKAASLMDSIKPNVETTRKLLDSLSETISNKTVGINTKLISIDNDLTNIHIGRAIVEYVVIGLICLVIGIFATLRITQTCYGKMIEKSYETELEIAKKDGRAEYESELINNNSGIIKIKEHEKKYVKNHKDSYKTPEDYIQELNEAISYLKESSWTKDDRMMK